MPEDYQAILNDLGVDTSTDGQPAASQDSTPVNPTATDNNVATPTGSGTPADNDANNTGNTGDNNDNAGAAQNNQADAGQTDNRNRANEAFASLRAENGKYKKFIQQLMRGAGYEGDEESFLNKLTEASYQRQAKTNQVSPEMLKRMDMLESQNRAVLESQNRANFIANMKNLQDTYKLSNNDLQEFLDLAVREKIDLTVPGTNFITLYQGLFFDKLKDKLIEEERQKWISQNNKANNASNPDGKSGKKDPTPTDVNTMAEFDRLLQSIPKDTK